MKSPQKHETCSRFLRLWTSVANHFWRLVGQNSQLDVNIYTDAEYGWRKTRYDSALWIKWTTVESDVSNLPSPLLCKFTLRTFSSFILLTWHGSEFEKCDSVNIPKDVVCCHKLLHFGRLETFISYAIHLYYKTWREFNLVVSNFMPHAWKLNLYFTTRC